MEELLNTLKGDFSQTLLYNIVTRFINENDTNHSPTISFGSVTTKAYFISCISHELVDLPINEYELAIELFISDHVNGIVDLLSLIYDSNIPCTELSVFYVVKLIYMITSQSSAAKDYCQAQNKPLILSALICRFNLCIDTNAVNSSLINHNDFYLHPKKQLFVEICKLLYALDPWITDTNNNYLEYSFGMLPPIIQSQLQFSINKYCSNGSITIENNQNVKSIEEKNLMELINLILIHIIYFVVCFPSNTEQTVNNLSNTLHLQDTNEMLLLCQEHVIQLCILLSNAAVLQKILSLYESLVSDCSVVLNDTTKTHLEDRDGLHNRQSFENFSMLKFSQCLSEQLKNLLLKTMHIQKIAERGSVILPLLIVLTKIIKFIPQVKNEVKKDIFPSFTAAEDMRMEYNNKSMDPTDAPIDTYRGQLISLMTSFDNHIKRYSSELLYLLCDENADEFVHRTGFGNAIALMQIKGLI
eukprot:gene4494-6350_t